MSDVRLSYPTLAAGAVATVAFLVVSSGSAVKTVIWSVPFVLAAVLLGARYRVSRAEVRRPLRLLLAGQLLYLGASLVWYVGPVEFGVVLPFPSLLDPMFFAAYAFYGAFLFTTIRSRAGDGGLQSRLALIDAAIPTLALSALLWVAVVEPNLSNGTPALHTVVAVAYPGVQLLLFGLAARLALSPKLRAQRTVAVLLFVWIGAELLADVFYGYRSANGTFRYDGPLIPLWMLSYTALGVLAVHPGLDGFLRAEREKPAGAGSARIGVRRPLLRGVRLGALLLAAAVPLGLAAFTQGDDPALMTVALVIFALALYRASLLSGDLAEQRRLGAELADALTHLRAQHGELARLAAVVASTSDVVVTCSLDGVVVDWNRGAERLYGYSREEAIGQQFATFLPAEDQPDLVCGLASATEQDGATVERVVVRKDGTPVEVETALSVFYDDSGPTIVGISRDVTERNRMQRELAAHAHRLDEAQRIAGVGSWDWDLTTDIVTCSPELYRIFSVQPEATVTPQFFLDRVHPDDRDAVNEQIGRQEPETEFETRIVRAGGEVRWIAVRLELVVDSAGAPVFKVGTVQDVTERRTLQHELLTQAGRLDEAQRLAGVGSFERDLATGRDLWSSEYYRILGVDEGTDATSALYLERLHPDDRPSVQEQMKLHEPGQPLKYEARIVRPDGEVRWVAVRGELHAGPDGVAVRKTGTAHDITDRKAAEAEFERLALTDALTGLANRAGFTRLLQAALEQDNPDRAVGLLLLDLDGFKDVNDGIGHHAGDLVLQEVARRVSAVLRRGDEVARLGGDEFAFVLPGIGDVDRAIEVATTVRSCLARPFDLDGITVHVGGSIGIAVGADRTESGALLKQADVAMYRAKTLSSGWAVFEPDEDDLAAGRLQMVTDLREVIDRDELDVAYQPIIDAHTRRVSSFEALARWHHPEKGTIPPDQFIPLAEQADLIVPLTRLVLRKAVAACAAWRKAGHDLRVGVNLSVQVMETENPCEMVTDALAEAGLEAQHLVLEITESSLATEGDHLNEILRALRETGVTLVIDDFGTGYSAMSYLKQLPVEELKIDRSFIRDIATDSRDLAIVRSLVRLAHSLSLRVVAEGVESAPALEVLAALGCDFAQGYGIARPMPQADTAAWLARYDTQAAAGVADAEPVDLLIVDDSAVVRTHLTALAAKAGWRVRAAASAEQAIDEVEQSTPDVVVLDHHMTGMTGMAAVPLLRARGVDGPILLFTQFLSDAIPSQRMPLDVWPVSKSNPDAVLELLEGYRTSTRQSGHAPSEQSSRSG